MRRRRRYEVVVEGLSGQAASQRSVISDHRSEAEARDNAALERARLEVIYGDGARSWRILVMREDEIVAIETPHGGEEPRRRSAERAPRTRMEPAPPPAAPAPDPDPDPVPEEVPASDAADAARPPAGEVARDDAPEEPPGPADRPGRVPDWLIARVEESIARQRERTYGPDARDEDDESRR
ncbi:MAG: hypothetical protein JHC74_15620 [Thermoleophilia bacterium]|nr:hypothetical protein [Thermoleophilia bacterium]